MCYLIASLRRVYRGGGIERVREERILKKTQEERRGETSQKWRRKSINEYTQVCPVAVTT